MRCPFCHAGTPPGASRCPGCGRPLPSGAGPVLEPEIVDDGPEAGRPAREKDPFTRVFYTSFFTGQGVPAGCVPSFVSLGLALLMAFAHGPLAGIGFLVFTALGRAFTFFLIIRYFLEGRHVNPRLFLIANWVFCWLLTVWLAGG